MTLADARILVWGRFPDARCRQTETRENKVIVSYAYAVFSGDDAIGPSVEGHVLSSAASCLAFSAERVRPYTRCPARTNACATGRPMNPDALYGN